MSQEEKIHLLAELTQEKHQHMLDLDRLKQAEDNLSLANDSVENLSQQLALYSQLNTTLQENLDSLSQMLQMNEQQLVQEKMRNSASDRSQHELEELRQTLEDAQTNFKQEIGKVSEEKRRIEEEYRMLEAQKVGLEHTLEVVKGELEVERLQATLAQQEAALRETSVEGSSAGDLALINDLQEQISRLTQQLEVERSRSSDQIVINSASRDDELAVLRSRVAIAERERSQLADRLQELEYRNAANLTKMSGLAEELQNCQKGADSQDAARLKEEIQRAHEEEKRSLLEELNRLRHAEESLKREVEGAQRKFQYLSEDYQKNQEAKDALEESNDNLQSRFNKLQREKNELQTQVKRLVQEKEEGGIQLKKAIEEKEETTKREESRLLQALEDQLSQLKGEKTALETEKSGLGERVKKLQAELETKTHEERSKHEDSANICHLEERLQEFGSQNAQLQHLLKEEQSKSHLLQDELKKNHEELQSFQSTTLKQHQIKERDLEERVAELEVALNATKESHHDTVSLRQALDQAHKAAEAEKETASRLAKQNNEDRAKIHELVKVNSSLKKQIKELNSAKQSQTEIEELKKRLRDEMVSHSGTLQQLEDSQKTFQESNEIIEKLTSDITRLQDSSAPLKREIDSLKAKNAQLTRVLAEEREAWKLEQQRQEQMKQAHDEQMQTAALESLRKEYEETQKEAREEINSKTRALQTEREAHERTKQQLTEITQSYERERNVIPDLRNQLKEALDMNMHSKKQTESSSRELQDSYAKLSNELQDEQKVHSATKAQMKQLSTTITALQADLTKAKVDNGELINNLHRLEQSLEESLNLHNEEQRSSNAQLSQRTAQVLELTQQLLDFEKENSHLQEEVQQYKADVATLTEGHRQLENEARTQTDKREAEKRVDQDTIKQLREALTQHKQQDESTLRQLEVELGELKQELARERDSHQATKELLEKERIDMELTMIESLHVQINRLRELYDSQGLIERDFHQAQSYTLEDVRPTYYFGQHQQPTITSHPHSHSHSHTLPHASVPASAPTGYHRDNRVNESFSLLQRELSNERETLQRTQEELDEERRLSRTQRELANELQLHVKELERAHNETARDLSETQKQISELKRELDRERNSRKLSSTPTPVPSLATSSTFAPPQHQYQQYYQQQQPQHRPSSSSGPSSSSRMPPPSSVPSRYETTSPSLSPREAPSFPLFPTPSSYPTTQGTKKQPGSSSTFPSSTPTAFSRSHVPPSISIPKANGH